MCTTHLQGGSLRCYYVYLSTSFWRSYTHYTYCSPYYSYTYTIQRSIFYWPRESGWSWKTRLMPGYFSPTAQPSYFCKRLYRVVLYCWPYVYTSYCCGTIRVAGMYVCVYNISCVIYVLVYILWDFFYMCMQWLFCIENKYAVCNLFTNTLLY